MAITELDIGGAEKAFVRIAVGLSELGWNVNVISLRDAGPLAVALSDAGISVVALNCGGSADLRAIVRMKRALTAQRPDVLLTFLHQANIVGRLAGRWAGVRSIVSGIRVADRRWAVMIPERLTSCCVDQYVAVSATVADVHRQLCHLRTDRVSVIPNGVDMDAIRQAVPADRKSIQCDESDWIILCVGRLTDQKAPLDVLDAFARLKQQRKNIPPNMKLVFVGEGPLRPQIESRIQSTELQNDVKVPGWRPDVWELMKSSNLLVLASRWEGLPNVVLEAQAAGLPVVASAVDGCSELISDGQTGRLFRCGDVTDLTRVMDEMLSSPELLTLMSAMAKKSVEAQYRWDRCISDFDQLLCHVRSAVPSVFPP
jgi:starch synthase (maltosyl-transferring)